MWYYITDGGDRMTENISYSVVRSDRHSCAVQVKRDGSVVVRVPRYMSQTDIAELVNRKSAWIIKTRAEVLAALERSAAPALTRQVVKELADRAMAVIPDRVRHFAPMVCVDYGRVTIRNQVSRWGSCSAQGNLSLNCLLMLTPAEVQDYIVVHELCHRRHMDHSAEFWADVERVLPGYRSSECWLKCNGGALIDNMKSHCT